MSMSKNNNEMTKERLAAYRSNKAEIRELSFRLENRWKDENLIGNDTIFDYKKGYPMPQSVIGFDNERYERLQDRDLHRKERLVKENKEIWEFVDSIQDSLVHRIFLMYFIEGDAPINQEMVANIVHLERSSVSKIITNFIEDSHNSHESHL